MNEALPAPITADAAPPQASAQLAVAEPSSLTDTIDQLRHDLFVTRLAGAMIAVLFLVAFIILSFLNKRSLDNVLVLMNNAVGLLTR